LIRAHPARTGTTVLMLATPRTDAGTAVGADTAPNVAPPTDGQTDVAIHHTDSTLHIGPDATLTVTGPTGTVIAGISANAGATASGLSAAEAQGCAALYALGPADAPMPNAHTTSHATISHATTSRATSRSWQAYADAAGALTSAHVLPRDHPSVPQGPGQADVDLSDDNGCPADLDDALDLDLGDRGDLGDEDRGDEGGGDEGGGTEGGGTEGGGTEGGGDEGGGTERVDEQGPGRVGGAGPGSGASEREAARAMGAVSVLDGPDEEYLDVAATTREDLEALAPAVPVEVRKAVAGSDPGLDEEIAAWFADSSSLPRLTLLGPVGARTRGVPVTKRKPYYTELLTYLATRPHGATPEEVAAAFDITATKARGYVATVRDWLGTNPRTGHPHIPDARHSAAAEHRGVGVYEVQDLLVDADLFRRLRLRGETRGPDGIQDLKRALTLVSGPPFSKLRPGGWTWLAEGDRLDQHLLCAVVDVAHLVTTHLLHTGDLDGARATAELAALAAPDDEIPRLDLAAVAMASGHRSTATDIIKTDICNRADDAGAPDELSARTHAILERHGWLTDDRQAAS
ncbi:AfsR/SARP family transcriptional regulator, partial [Aquipuribacter sp. MA13-13]|uniref:AfsR/SARP family transcriptional regulator n=1 Tax=Aquipuribacter sp. MA13-13 TaxID=3440840 RepID=UPI003EEA9246